MVGLDPTIHKPLKTWILGSSPRMTDEREAKFPSLEHVQQKCVSGFAFGLRENKEIEHFRVIRCSPEML